MWTVYFVVYAGTGEDWNRVVQVIQKECPSEEVAQNTLLALSAKIQGHGFITAPSGGYV
jgi:hypothetical protein